MKQKHYDIKMISWFVDGRLSGESLREVEKHLSECAECREKARSVELVNRLLRVIPKEEDVSGASDSIFYAKLDELIRKRQKVPLSEIISWKIKDVVDSLQVPQAVPVLARAAVFSIFLAAAVFTGFYVTRPDMPLITAVSGVAYISRGDTGVWDKLEKNTRINKNDVVKAGDYSEINLSLANKYYIRLKEKTSLKVAKLSPRVLPGSFRAALSKGDVFVDIGKKFKGSQFYVNTELAEVRALGTKFMVSVPELMPKTWVGVVEGQVQVKNMQALAALEGGLKEVVVKTGMKTEVILNRPLLEPLPLLENEWEQLSELYMLGKKTRIALLISGDEERVLELLAPCALYVIDEKPRTLPEQLEEAVRMMERAAESGDREMHLEVASKLEEVIEANPGAEYNVQLLLFMGAYYEYAGMYQEAIDTFDRMVEEHSSSPFVSLAECAKAVIYERSLNEPATAKKIYEHIIKDYPYSPEAGFARSRMQ